VVKIREREREREREKDAKATFFDRKLAVRDSDEEKYFFFRKKLNLKHFSEFDMFFDFFREPQINNFTTTVGTKI
jgi:hypothetical protein